MIRSRTLATALVVGVLGAALVVAADDPPRTARPAPPAPSPTPAASPAPARELPARVIAPYEPPSIEPYVNGKRVAGRVAQAAATYDRGITADELARAVTNGRGVEAMARTLRPLIHRGARSAGEVIYVQLSGVTPTALGAMVVLRQRLDWRDGRRRTVTRTFDVRLARRSGPWSLARIASVGGRPARRPVELSVAAARAIEHPRIFLPDTARWDIYRGLIDERLLATLARAAKWRSISVTALRTAHPPNVWATRRPSAHARGLAADVYAVDGQLVLRQRRAGSAARSLARSFVAASAAQVGSPWVFAPGGRRSFTDAVHQDHIHVQAAVNGA